MKPVILALAFSLFAVAVDSALREELLHRVEQDQAARIAVMNWMETRGGMGAIGSNDLTPTQQVELKQLTSCVAEIDAENTRWLKTVLVEHGWPTKSLVGKDGANAAWLLVQHADKDVKFQRKCLDQMAKLSKGEVAPQEVAYLNDRVLLAEGKKQLYGTQFVTVDGKLQPRPIEDETNVDARRKEVGLPPLAEYAKLIERQYGPNRK